MIEHQDNLRIKMIWLMHFILINYSIYYKFRFMIPLQSEPLHASHFVPMSSVVTGVRHSEQLEGVELALIEARGRILGALDRELEAVRARRTRHTNGLGIVHEVFQQSPLPANVLTVSREAFELREPAPLEAAIDPALERATLEELNAALAAAFSQMSAP